jgi:hypothetical protein
MVSSDSEYCDRCENQAKDGIKKQYICTHSVCKTCYVANQCMVCEDLKVKRLNRNNSS